MATPEMDEEMARKEIRDTFTATKARGCPTEILLRDVVTLGGNANNAIRWTEIAREESEKYTAEAVVQSDRYRRNMFQEIHLHGQRAGITPVRAPVSLPSLSIA